MALVQWPTEQEAMAFADLDALRAHVGVHAGVLTAVTQRTGALNNQIALLAALPPTTIERAIAGGRVVTTAAQGQVPAVTRNIGPAEATQVGSMWRIARRIVFCRNGADWADTLATDVDPNLALPAAPPLQQAPPQQAQAPPQLAQSKYKTSDVLDPMDESEFQDPTAQQVQAWNAAYVADAQVDPPRLERASPIQLMAMYTRVVVRGKTPYANFSTLTPFERRVTQRNKYQHMHYAGSGKWQLQERQGPENFRQWLTSYRVFGTLMRSLTVVVNSALCAYEKKIQDLADQYHDAWGLIYQADDLMRAEEMELTRAKLQQQATAGNPPTLWDPASPWSAVFFFAATDDAFWRTHVLDPANLWVARGKPGSSRRVLPDAAAAEGHLPGGADLYHGAPDLGQVPGRTSVNSGRKRSRTPSSSRARGKKRKRPSAAERKRRAVSEALKKERKKFGGKKKRKRSSSSDDAEPAVLEAACFSYSKGYGPCAKMKAGSKCKQKVPRTHKCHCCGGAHSAKEKGCKPAKTKEEGGQ